MSVTGARTLDATSDGKPHFDVLDGLRGTAALLVVAFHIQGITVLFEASRLLLPHAYLAVDFFFALSGFVVGYAYDDRWGRMTVREFFAWRLVRLHPLVVLGAVLGLASYCVDQPRRIESSTSSLNGISPSISQQGLQGMIRRSRPLRAHGRIRCTSILMPLMPCSENQSSTNA